MADELADPNACMALDSSSKNTPPGWKPGIRTYPFRRYEQLMKLWQMTTEMNQTRCGAASIQRLEGSAFQFAMSLKPTIGDNLYKCQTSWNTQVNQNIHGIAWSNSTLLENHKKLKWRCWKASLNFANLRAQLKIMSRPSRWLTQMPQIEADDSYPRLICRTSSWRLWIWTKDRNLTSCYE